MVPDFTLVETASVTSVVRPLVDRYKYDLNTHLDLTFKQIKARLSPQTSLTICNTFIGHSRITMAANKKKIVVLGYVFNFRTWGLATCNN